MLNIFHVVKRCSFSCNCRLLTLGMDNVVLGVFVVVALHQPSGACSLDVSHQFVVDLSVPALDVILPAFQHERIK